MVSSSTQIQHNINLNKWAINKNKLCQELIFHKYKFNPSIINANGTFAPLDFLDSNRKLIWKIYCIHIILWHITYLYILVDDLSFRT